MDEIIEHLAIFVSNLWQIHIFEEGNTRTTAVFFIKYLRNLGFDVSNDSFAKNAWYFRNSLVRANYNNVIKGVFEDRLYIIKFLRNLLLNENNELHNRDLRILPMQNERTTKKEEKLLIEIKNNPHIKTEELAKKLNVSPRTIKSEIKVLVNDGKIERVNGKRYGYWKINE